MRHLTHSAAWRTSKAGRRNKTGKDKYREMGGRSQVVSIVTYGWFILGVAGA